MRSSTHSALTFALLKEYHALIVSQGKEVCRTRPLCERCALRRTCAAALTDPIDESL
jgi:endonuclease III related protein